MPYQLYAKITRPKDNDRAGLWEKRTYATRELAMEALRKKEQKYKNYNFEVRKNVAREERKNNPVQFAHDWKWP